jgi:5-methyltetrahydrofolate--homocysteine methyltransferase
MLTTQPVVLADGAMGTMLMAAGLEPGTSPERWNVEHPDRVQAVHRAYAEAGTRLVLTNTFGGTRLRLGLHGLGDQIAKLNQAAVRIAREAVADLPYTVLVGGSIGPTGEMLEPLGALAYDDAVAVFAEQAAVLDASSVDYFQVETFGDLREMDAAIQGVRSVSSLPIIATMSFDTRRRTMMGVRPEQAASHLAGLGVAALGANCGAGIEDTLYAVGEMHAATPESVVVAKSNAGLPRQSEGGVMLYDGTPERMAEYAREARARGARIIGACCGSTPAHIRAMAETLGLA